MTHSGSFKLSVNNSSGISLDVLVFKLPPLGFLDASPTVELLLKSLYGKKILLKSVDFFILSSKASYFGIIQD